MKKQGLIAAMLLLTIVAGCGGSSGSSAAQDSNYGGSSGTDAGWIETPNAKEALTEDEAQTQTSPSAVRENAKLILSANLTLQAQEFEQTRVLIEDLTAKVGGYIEGSDAFGETGSREVQYTVRVPQKEFEGFLQQVGESCHVVRSSQSAEDIADQYTDLEIHLATLKTKHERLLSLLKNAEKMEDIIALETALSDTEYEIDQLTGEKRRYDGLVGFATISIDLLETQNLASVSEGVGFGSQLKKAAISGWNGFKGLIQGLILLAASLWPIVLIVVLIVFFAVKRARRNQRKQAPQPPRTPPVTDLPPMPSAPPVPAQPTPQYQPEEQDGQEEQENGDGQ